MVRVGAGQGEAETMVRVGAGQGEAETMVRVGAGQGKAEAMVREIREDGPRPDSELVQFPGLPL